jgi:peroxiredoxin
VSGNRPPELVREGDVPPPTQGADLDGDPLALADYRNKVILLAFWNFGSQKSKEMIPYERSLVLRLKRRPFAMLGVNSDNNRTQLSRDLVTHEVNWRSFRDQKPDGGSVSRDWGVRTWPTLFLVDHRGVIRHRFVDKPDETHLENCIQALVREAEQDLGK